MCGVAVVLVLAAPVVPVGSLGPAAAEPDLGSILLDTAELPPGFVPNRNQSGPHTVSAKVPDWLAPLARGAAPVHGYDRVWINQGARRAIIAQVMNYPVYILASTDTNSVVRDHQARAIREFVVPAVPDARGIVVPNEFGQADSVYGIFVRGPRAFHVAVLAVGSTEEDIGLVRRLVETQAAKAPPGDAELRDVGKVRVAVGTAVGAVGAVGTYVGGLSLWAWLRDPLHRPGPPAPPSAPLAATPVVDISARSARRRRRVAAASALEVGAAAMKVAGLLPFTWPWGLLLLLVGAGGIRLCRRVAGAPATELPVWTGRRRLRVAGYLAFSTVLIVGGLVVVLLYGVGSVVTSPAYGDNLRLLVIGVGLWAVGTLVRSRAGRLAALDARAALHGDTRPLVLYLRTFTDDAIRIRSEPFARRSVVDWLTPRRFERFEEMLVRTLTAVGPVVALNPPGTDLAPIGAARERLASDQWQSTVAEWMTRARIIVVGAAPETVSSGLRWELDRISAHVLWPRTVLVFPPLPEHLVRERWQQLRTVISESLPAGSAFPEGSALPEDAARMIVLRASPVSAVVADRRTGLTYAEALAAAS